MWTRNWSLSGDHSSWLARAVSGTERRLIPGYLGYGADSLGRVWNLVSHWRCREPRILAVAYDERHRYGRVNIYLRGKRQAVSLHVLIASAFHGSRPAGLESRHLDGDRRNNRPDNLKWGTAQDNANDRQAHGTTRQGSRVGTSKLTELDITEIRRLRRLGASYRELQTRFRIGHSNLWNILARRTWKHVEEDLP